MYVRQLGDIPFLTSNYCAVNKNTLACSEYPPTLCLGCKCNTYPLAIGLPVSHCTELDQVPSLGCLDYYCDSLQICCLVVS